MFRLSVDFFLPEGRPPSTNVWRLRPSPPVVTLNVSVPSSPRTHRVSARIPPASTVDVVASVETVAGAPSDTIGVARPPAIPFPLRHDTPVLGKAHDVTHLVHYGGEQVHAPSCRARWARR